MSRKIVKYACSEGKMSCVSLVTGVTKVSGAVDKQTDFRLTQPAAGTQLITVIIG